MYYMYSCTPFYSQQVKQTSEAGEKDLTVDMGRFIVCVNVYVCGERQNTAFVYQISWFGYVKGIIPCHARKGNPSNFSAYFRFECEA